MQLHPAPIRRERFYLDERSIDVPLFDSGELPQSYCARFARLASENLFGKNYPISDAWDMRDSDGVFSLALGDDGVVYATKNGILTPGMLVGSYYKWSRANDGKRPYTHLSLYVGTHHGEPVFLEQFRNEVRLSTMRDYDLSGLEVREILAMRGNQGSNPVKIR